jgi:hypothetical protein
VMGRNVAYLRTTRNVSYIILSRGFGLVNRFIGSLLLVTTNNFNIFKITVIITHTLSRHRSPTNFPWLSPIENSTEQKVKV